MVDFRSTNLANLQNSLCFFLMQKPPTIYGYNQRKLSVLFQQAMWEYDQK